MIRMAKVLVPLAHGAEEMEAVIIVDVFRRAGWNAVLAATAGRTVEASRGVKIVADAGWDDVQLDSFDLLVLPGGNGGTESLRADSRVLDAIRAFEAAGKLVCAICAGPLVLQEAGVLAGRKATCHPGARSELTVPDISDERVVIDRGIVTSQAPGTAFEFALAIVRLVDGAEVAEKVAAGLVLP
jgi:4-methyl-5(b-hydroxyethyl)-thiazole monophosphate biosynthesis